MAVNTKITKAMKIAIVQGAINSFGDFNAQYLKVYNLLINLGSIKKVKPFNFLRNTAEISDDAEVLKAWLSMFSTGDDEHSVSISCRRVAREVIKLSTDYGDLLPYDISGVDSFSTLFRVFFIPDAMLVSVDEDTLYAITTIKSLLNLILWLDLVTESPQYKATGEDWLLCILQSAGSSILSFVNQLNSRGAINVG